MGEDLELLRKQAEAAVADMADREMKLRAFEVILSHLLAGTGGENPPLPKRDGASPGSAQVAGKVGISLPRSSRERLAFLQRQGFFANQRSLSDVQEELRKNGWHYPVTALSGPLQTLVQRRVLRREQGKDGNRTIWKYSNF